MDTKTFLQAILPTEGVYFLAVMKHGYEGLRHKAFSSFEQMQKAVEALNDNPNLTVYHACASFRQPYLEKPDGRYEYRTKRNALYARAFWLDIDVGPEKESSGKGYGTKKQAAVALGEFCTVSGFPTPMVIDSGYGIHCYWSLDENVPAAKWRQMANNFDLVLKRHGLRVDESATSDVVRVLRPVGSYNRKDADNPKTVKALTPVRNMTLGEFESILRQNMDDLGIFSSDAVDSMNQDLFAHAYDGPSFPSSAKVIATKCNQIRVLAQTQGDVPYEVWRAGVGGIAKHCTEGEEIAEQWTVKRHENHSRTNYEHEMNTWEVGPPTCAHFEKFNPEGCQGCPHQGKIKSPIVLGFEELDMSEQANEKGEVEVEVQGVSESEPLAIPALPKGYAWVDNRVLCRSVPIPDEERIEYVPFCDTLIYAIARVRKDEDKRTALLVRAIFPREGARDFLVDTAALSSPADTTKAVAAFQVMPSSHKSAGVNLMAYLRDWLSNLQKTTDEKALQQQFGWDEDKEFFVCGSRAYMGDGSIAQVIPGNKIRSSLNKFPDPKGDLDVWVNTIDDIFNHPTELHRQYAIANAFGCVLTPLCSDSLYNGIVFAITGGETAKGKTTTAIAGASAFGDPVAQLQGSSKGATLNARYGILSVLQNLPALIDEVTHMDAEDLSQFCYAVSMGADKQRMRNDGSNGVALADSSRWATSPYVTANTDLHLKLASRGVNSAAEAVRLIEIYIDEQKHTHREMDEMNRKVKKLLQNQGLAGEKFIQYVVANRGDVLDIMERWAKRASNDIEDSKFRQYRSHAECTMAALEICKDLGLVRFDIEAIYQYAIGLFKRLADDVYTTHQVSAEDAVSAMISYMTPHTIVTDFYKDSRNREQDRVTGIREGKVYGRLITGGGNDNAEELAGRLYISANAMRDWCLDNRTTSPILVDEMKRLGFWIDLEGRDKFVLGRGTTMATGQSRCICLDYRKITDHYGADNTPKVSSGTPQSNLLSVKSKGKKSGNQ